jgi:hypothetical protein
MTTKCMINGEPLTVKHKILPVSGTVRETVAREFKGSTIKHPDQAGECPGCRAYVPLSGKGFITAHMTGGESAPVSPELSERSVETTDTGAKIGDPETGSRRRATEIDGAFERGTVKVPRPGEKGRIKLTEVPATEESVREALDYWRTRKPRSDAGRKAQSDNVSALVRRLDAMRKAETIVHAPVDAPVSVDVATVKAPAETSMRAAVSPDGLTTPKGRGALTGAPLVKGRQITPFAGEVTVRRVGEAYERPAPAEDERRGWHASAGTMAGPLGREKLDRVAATVPERSPELSASQKRRARRKRCHAAYGAAQVRKS